MSKSVGAMVVALVIAFVYGWQIALLSFAFVPVMAFCQAMLYSVFMGDAADKDRVVFEEAGQCTTEATMNIRTVASLGREEYFINKYQEKLDTPLKNHTKKAYLYGFLYGMANSTEFFMYAAIFRFAAWLIEADHMQSSDFDNIFKVLFSLVFGAMTAGEASAMMPDQAQAQQARVSEILNSKVGRFCLHPKLSRLPNPQTSKP